MTRNFWLRLSAGIIIASIWTASAGVAGAQQTSTPSTSGARAESPKSDAVRKSTPLPADDSV